MKNNEDVDLGERERDKQTDRTRAKWSFFINLTAGALS